MYSRIIQQVNAMFSQTAKMLPLRPFSGARFPTSSPRGVGTERWFPERWQAGRDYFLHLYTLQRLPDRPDSPGQLFVDFAVDEPALSPSQPNPLDSFSQRLVDLTEPPRKIAFELAQTLADDPALLSPLITQIERAERRDIAENYTTALETAFRWRYPFPMSFGHFVHLTMALMSCQDGFPSFEVHQEFAKTLASVMAQNTGVFDGAFAMGVPDLAYEEKNLPFMMHLMGWAADIHPGRFDDLCQAFFSGTFPGIHNESLSRSEQSDAAQLLQLGLYLAMAMKLGQRWYLSPTYLSQVLRTLRALPTPTGRAGQAAFYTVLLILLAESLTNETRRTLTKEDTALLLKRWNDFPGTRQMTDAYNQILTAVLSRSPQRLPLFRRYLSDDFPLEVRLRVGQIIERVGLNPVPPKTGAKISAPDPSQKLYGCFQDLRALLTLRKPPIDEVTALLYTIYCLLRKNGTDWPRSFLRVLADLTTRRSKKIARYAQWALAFALANRPEAIPPLIRSVHAHTRIAASRLLGAVFYAVLENHAITLSNPLFIKLFQQVRRLTEKATYKENTFRGLIGRIATPAQLDRLLAERWRWSGDPTFDRYMLNDLIQAFRPGVSKPLSRAAQTALCEWFEESPLERMNVWMNLWGEIGQSQPFPQDLRDRVIEGVRRRVGEWMASPTSLGLVHPFLKGCLFFASTWETPELVAQLVTGVASRRHSPVSAEFRDAIVDEWALLSPQIREAIRQAVSGPLQDDPDYLWVRHGLGVAGPLDDSFAPARKIFRDHFSQGEKTVLMVQNIRDGMGDELIRFGIFLQHLLKMNAELKVIMVTERPFLYDHPRIAARSLEWLDKHKESLTPDLVISYYTANRYANGGIQPWVDSLSRHENPPFMIQSGWVTDNLQRILIPGQSPLLVTTGRFGSNVYGLIYEMCAELGIPALWGEAAAPEESPYVSRVSQAARREWKIDVEWANTQNRPVVAFNGFGGSTEEKGFSARQRREMVAEIESLIRNGEFVVLLPNHQKWGGPAACQAIIDRLSESVRPYIAVGPDPKRFPSRTKFFTLWSDRVVTVEGGMMHLASALGKPLIVRSMEGERITQWWFNFTRREDQVALPFQGRFTPADQS